MVVTIPAAGARRAGGAGRGVMAGPLAETVRRALHAAAAISTTTGVGRAGSGRCNKQTAAIRGAVTQRRKPELNADTVRCRPSAGSLPTGSALPRSTTRAPILHPAPTSSVHPLLPNNPTLPK